jgi:hypothetical protein
MNEWVGRKGEGDGRTRRKREKKGESTYIDR